MSLYCILVALLEKGNFSLKKASRMRMKFYNNCFVTLIFINWIGRR